MPIQLNFLAKDFLLLRQNFGIETKILYTMIIPFLALPFLPELSIWFSARWSRCANDWCVVNSADASENRANASENRANVASYIADVLTLYTQCLFSLLDREKQWKFSLRKVPWSQYRRDEATTKQAIESYRPPIPRGVRPSENFRLGVVARMANAFAEEISNTNSFILVYEF